MALRLVLGKLKKEEKAIRRVVKKHPNAAILGRRYLTPPGRNYRQGHGHGLSSWRNSWPYTVTKLELYDRRNDPRFIVGIPHKYEIGNYVDATDERLNQIVAETIVSDLEYEVTKVDFGCMINGAHRVADQEWLLEDMKRFNLENGNYDKWERSFEERLKKRLFKLKTFNPQLYASVRHQAEAAVSIYNQQQQNTNLEPLAIIDVYFESGPPSRAHLVIKACDVAAQGMPTLYKAVVAEPEWVLEKFMPLMSESEFEAIKPVEREKLVFTGTTFESKFFKDPSVPKRPPTSYSLFMQDFWKGYKEQLPGAILLKEASKECGKKWRSLTDQEKKPYLVKAAALKDKAMEAC